MRHDPSSLPRKVRHPPLDRPVMIYDGDCHFCRRWIERWRRTAAGRVDFCEYQKLGLRWPEIPRTAFAKAVQLVELDGTVLSGADAVFRVLEFSPAPSRLARTLGRIPGFIALARAAYRFIAAHRSVFSRLTFLA